MTKYVLGFAFSNDLERVVLIQKRKPEFQHGKFNGVGGKLEFNEASEDAMTREFKEETGLHLGNWVKFIEMVGPNWTCDCYFSIIAQDTFEQIRTTESEFIIKAPVNNLPSNCMRNLHWLIPMALNWDQECAKVVYAGAGNK